MSELLTPFIKLQQQMIDAHKANVDATFRSMNNTGFEGAAQAAKQLADAQIKAWEMWLAVWGPRG